MEDDCMEAQIPLEMNDMEGQRRLENDYTAGHIPLNMIMRKMFTWRATFCWN